jgi:guanine deaminase
MQAAGIRAFVGKLSMDISSRPSYVEASTQDALSSVESFVQKCRAIVSHLPEHKQLVEPVITPRFVPTCSDNLLTGLGTISESQSIRIQSHLAEAYDQVEWVKRERGVDDIDVFDRHKLLTSRTIQAHCTFLEPPSLSHLCARGTAIAHCPLSNAYFSAKPFPLREALQRSVKVGLGTDVAGGYSLDIMDAMRQAVAVSRMREGSRMIARAEKGLAEFNPQESLGVDWKETLFLATRGGALALGMHPKSGIFEVGAPFDAQCIQLFDSKKIGIGQLDFLDTSFTNDARLTADMVEKWWCIGNTENRVGMWVQGTKLA